MTHLVFIEDAHGDVVDQEVYCSDFCASTSDLYNGWNGCNEINVSEPCASCGQVVLAPEQQELFDQAMADADMGGKIADMIFGKPEKKE